jgi:thiol-disulfide isomerase/thioredoxin
MKVMGSHPRYDFVRYLVARFLALLLLAAASLKISEALTHGFKKSWIFLVVCLDLLLGIWLLSGRRKSWALMVSAGTFLCFALATLSMIFQGITDCGCFGAIQLSPKITYWIDVMAFLAAMWAQGLSRFRILLPLVLIPAVTLYLAVMTLAGHPSPKARIEVGNPWPPKGAVDCPADLSQGRWIVLIYDSTCGHCRSLASDYTRDASDWGAPAKRTKLALLDAGIPDEQDTTAQLSQVVRGSLLKGEFYEHAPILLLLDQGKVLGIEEGWGAVDWSDPIHAPWIQ